MRERAWLTVRCSCADAELVKRRRLGQTKLEVKPGQVGMNNATKPENLGIFDYAHLRAPLPKDLKGSEIFAPQQHQHPPESYFLMVRPDCLLRMKLHKGSKAERLFSGEVVMAS